MKPLKAALLGLQEVGADYLAAIRSDERFDLTAVADADGRTLRRHADTTEIRVYEDHRSLIMETARAGLDVLFVALEPFQSHEFLTLAAERGISVFHKAPFARNTGEAGEVLRHFEDAGCPLVASQAWMWEPAFAGLSNVTELIGRVHAAAGTARTADGSDGWRGDSLRAGGGVLLNGAYDQVDILTTLLGMPEEVYAQSSMAVPPGAPKKYDTEDSMSVVLRFGGDRIATVAATRGTTRPCWDVALLGSDGEISLCAEQMTVVRAGAATQDRRVWTPNPVAPAIGAFATAVIAGEQRITSAGREHLPTLAVIEAAYLSAKTGTPESPARFLD